MRPFTILTRSSPQRNVGKPFLMNSNQILKSEHQTLITNVLYTCAEINSLKCVSSVPITITGWFHDGKQINHWTEHFEEKMNKPPVHLPQSPTTEIRCIRFNKSSPSLIETNEAISKLKIKK